MAEAKLVSMRGLGLGLLAFVLLLGSVLIPACAVRAARGDIIKVGVLEEPKSLNLWLASDAWSNRVLKMIFQPLYIKDPKTLHLTPWLAASQPVYDEKNIAYTVELREAKWSDGTPFTARDVAFTGRFIQQFKIPRYYSKWKFIKAIEVLSDRKLRFVLKKPKAVFLTRTLTTPIVQQKQWEAIIKTLAGEKKPLRKLLRHELKNPAGTGPFMMAKWKRGVFVYLKRNPYFFGTGRVIDGMKLGPYIKGIVFKVFGTADAAVLALRKGAIDMYWNGIQPGYLKQIKGEKGVKLFTNKKSALYFMGFNLRKAPFNDVHFRQATAFLISKDFIIRRILQGQGDVLHSVVPPGNRFYCNPDLPLYGHGLSRDQRVKAAYAILKKAGYTWDVPPVGPDGKVRRGEGIKEPDGKPMREFTILTPPADYDPHRAMAGQMIQEWLRAAGIPAFSRPMAFGALIQKVKGQRDFDCFVLGYGKLSMDPGYLRAFFGSKGDKPRGWNMSGYHNPEFDKLATASDNAMDPKQRRKIVFEMQRLLARDLPYIPLYNPLLVEGVREDRFRGWVPTVGGIGNLWSFCQIKPVR